MAVLALLGLTLSAGTGRAADLRRCDLIDISAAPGLVRAEEFSVRRTADGTVETIVLRTVAGRSSASDLTPLRPGVSVRHAVVPAGQGQQLATFNLVTVMPDGTIRSETWVRIVGRDDEAPRYVVTRLRCPA